MIAGIGGRQCGGTPMGGYRLFRLQQILQTDPQVIVDFGEIRPQREGLPIGADGTAMAVGLIEGKRQVKSRLNVVRVDFDTLQAGRDEEGLHGAVWFSQGLPEISQLKITFRGGRIGVHGPSKKVRTFLESSAPQQQSSQAECCHGVCRLVLEQAAIEDFGGRQIPVLLVFRGLPEQKIVHDHPVNWAALPGNGLW